MEVSELPLSDGRVKLNWETLEYVARYMIYPLILILFFMWSDIRSTSTEASREVNKKTAEISDKVQELQTSMAVYQSQNQLLVKMMEKVDQLEGRMTRSETILEMHREESTYDSMKKFPKDKK